MTSIEIITKIKKIDGIVQKYQDLIEEYDYRKLQDEVQLAKASDIEQKWKEVEEKKNFLAIGIIGRVKAGKSSLLNSLIFAGDDVLPKAATPMTASLTTLSYGQKPSVTIEWFTKEDTDKLKEEHDKHQRNVDKAVQLRIQEMQNMGKNPEREKIIKNIRQDLAKTHPARSAAHDIYQRMQDIDVDHIRSSTNTFEAETFDELKGTLHDYVAVNGKHMPMTKCLHIHLPEEKLKNLKIIDTPGVNDPVESRETRTYEMLGQCDVAFIVSPSGQFLNEQDINLMDRVNARAGVQELYLIASQSDLQLYGNLKKQWQGRLHDVLKDLLEILAKQAKQTLLHKLPDNPAICKLAQESERRLFVTSSACLTLLEQPEEKWDATAKHTYGMLKEEYPDYFATPEQTKLQLKNLSCVDKINDALDTVRMNKDKIFTEGLAAFLQTQSKAICNLQELLLTHIQKEEQKLVHTDKADIKKQMDVINDIRKKGETVATEVFLDSIEKFQLELPKQLESIIKAFYDETQASMRSAEGQDTRSVKKSGFWNGVARFVGAGGYENETYAILQAGTVRTALEDFKEQLQSELEYTVEEKSHLWRNGLARKVVSALREAIDDDQVQQELVTKVCRKLISELKEVKPPTLPNLPGNLKKSGRLSGYEKNDFEENARNYLNELRETSKQFAKKVKGEIKNIGQVDFAQNLFHDYIEKIKKLEEQIAAKNLTLEKYKNLISEIKDAV